MSKAFKGTNYKHGIQLDIDGSGGLADERYIPGSRDYVVYAPFAAADIPAIFFVAQVPCKVISCYERHVTVAGQAGTLQLEKVPSGTAMGSGTVMLASAFDLTSTANTNVLINAVTTSGATMAKGDAMACKLASGAATSYANGILHILIEYL